MNISSLFPPVNTAKLKQTKRSEVAVAGSEINPEAKKDAPKAIYPRDQRKKRGQDRRQRNIKPLIDMRSGRDRRKDSENKSINVSV